jgi:hypothetical protein
MTIQELAGIYRTDQRFSYSNPGRYYLAPSGPIGLLGFVDVMEWEPYQFARKEYGQRFWNRNSSWDRPVWTQNGIMVANLTNMSYRWRRLPKWEG